jgi:hypothetical protein
LDLWPVEKLDLYRQVNNKLINLYWEATLPSGFRKPGQSAAHSEVIKFITDKYVNKKWVDTDMKHDPAYLCEQRPKKF